MRKGLMIGAGLAGLMAVVAGLVLAKTKFGEELMYVVMRDYYMHRPTQASLNECKSKVLENSHDPDSIEWVNEDKWVSNVVSKEGETTYNVNVKIEARGNNAFGAKVYSRPWCEVIVISGDPLVIGFGYGRE